MFQPPLHYFKRSWDSSSQHMPLDLVQPGSWASFTKETAGGQLCSHMYVKAGYSSKIMISSGLMYWVCMCVAPLSCGSRTGNSAHNFHANYSTSALEAVLKTVLKTQPEPGDFSLEAHVQQSDPCCPQLFSADQHPTCLRRGHRVTLLKSFKQSL